MSFFELFLNFLKKGIYFTSGPRILWLRLVVVKPVLLVFQPFGGNERNWIFRNLEFSEKILEFREKFLEFSRKILEFSRKILEFREKLLI